MTTRLTELANLAALDALPESWCDDVTADVNYFVAPGLPLASGATIDITSRYHEVTGIVTVATITDLEAAVAGQEVILHCDAAVVFTVTGGNIKTIMGQDYSASAGENVKFVYDGAFWWPQVAKRWAKTTSKTVSATTTFTDLLNGELTVPQYVQGEGGIIKLIAWGDCENNATGVKPLPRWQVLYGGVTFLDTGATGNIFANAIGRYGWRIELEIQNLAHDSQQCYIKVGLMYLDGAATDADNVFTVGNGSYYAHGNGFGAYSRYMAEGGNVGLAVDTNAADQVLELNVKNGFSHAAYQTKLFGAVATIL